MVRVTSVAFSVLGPLQVQAGASSLSLGGPKQRAVLSLLLLRAGEPATFGYLVEGLWGEDAPGAASRTVEGYVSRLRRELEPHGVSIVRRGEGYTLNLGDGALDLDEAERLSSEASVALHEKHPDGAAAITRKALSLWRGPVLADVPLQGRARADVDRIEELRLRLLETWAEAELAQGRPELVAADLRPVRERHPYRERFVAQLMVALYRCGRQVEALEEYERLRRALDEELGLQPSQELQRLSGLIVRQDESLLLTTTPGDSPPLAPPARPRRRLALASAAGALAVVLAATLALVIATGKSPAGSASTRVALVVPQDPAAAPQDAVLTSIVDGLHRAEHDYGLTSEILVADEFDADAPSVERLRKRLSSESFGLVLVFGGLHEALTPLAAKTPSTRFAFFDRGPKIPNGTTFVFADDEAGYLAGYLSGLVEASGNSRLNKPHIVSTIGGGRGADPVEALLDGFTEGVRKALPDATVLRDYSQEFAKTSPCEALANRQIDVGADIVFAAAGRCSLGALSAAAIRRVWAVGVDSDQSYLGDHVLVSTVKRYDQAVLQAVRLYVQGTLPVGTVRLGLRDEAVGIVGVGASVPETIRKKVAQLALSMKNGERG